MQGLLSKLEQVNVTVIALTASMEAAHGNLVTANDNMVGSPHTTMVCWMYCREQPHLHGQAQQGADVSYSLMRALWLAKAQADS